MAPNNEIQIAIHYQILAQIIKTPQIVHEQNVIGMKLASDV